MTKLSKRVLNRLITYQQPMKPHDLVTDLQLNLRSVRYALKILSEMELIERTPDLDDLRTYYYYVPAKIAQDVKKLATG